MSDPLARYDTPACINDFRNSRRKRAQLRTAWDAVVDGIMQPNISTNFYDPKATVVGRARRARVEWTAFPKRTEDLTVSLNQKFEQADGRPNDTDERQFEYCEWCVERDPATQKILRITFTTESRAYFQELWKVDPDCVCDLNRKHVNRGVQLEDLHLPGDPAAYNVRNKWNTGNEYLPDRGGSMHMIVGINTIPLAVNLAGGAARNPRDAPTRGAHHADPMVILAVSRIVGRLQKRLSFTNPVGIYLQEPEFNRIELPAGAPRDVHPRDFWRVVRGKRSRGWGLRAVFRVPDRFGFKVSDLKIDGRPITHGSQLARTVKSGTYVTPLPHP